MASNSAAIEMMNRVAKMRREMGVAPHSIADDTITKFCQEIAEFQSMQRRKINETNPAWDNFWEK